MRWQAALSAVSLAGFARPSPCASRVGHFFARSASLHTCRYRCTGILERHAAEGFFVMTMKLLEAKGLTGRAGE